ncbi:MAG: hypothetical protein LUG91_03670 [Ruminococcus sp.]|nr:hypothetical protein [Ruminococcus sp.]
MIKITDFSEVNQVTFTKLREHLAKKILSLFEEYSVKNLENIGCFVVLDVTEYSMFDAAEMEFLEVLKLESEAYLHGVKIIDDGYAEDIYLPVEVIKC